ncbi:MAG TPA: hypothetical protein VEL05_00420 [Candidatus Acidoferrum sp.]|nr:hypothetical protein [Candidatus Acidoferrum sp.]
MTWSSDNGGGVVVRSPSLGILGTGSTLRQAEADGLRRAARLIRRQIAGLHLIYTGAEADRVVGDDPDWAEGSHAGEDPVSAETVRLLSGIVRELNAAALRLDELAELVAIADPDDEPLEMTGTRMRSVRGTPAGDELDDGLEDKLERPATGSIALRWPTIPPK